MIAPVADRPAVSPREPVPPAGAEPVPPAPPDRPPRRRDDWPHTTRVLPWLLAGFVAMLWLVPFNAISLNVSLPFAVDLDGIVLPVVLLAWAVVLAAGGPSAPRVRITAVHVAIGAFVAVALLSVVLNAGGLNEALRYDEAMKRLVLLGSFVALFGMLASVVRPQEVRAFLMLSLGLAVLCSIGVLWEHNVGPNLFYQWSAQLLPGLFHITPVDTSGVDEIGRRLTLGPGETGLETASMLAMALPVALVGMMGTSRRRDRVLYGLAACLIVAAGISTYRKTAMIAPAVAVLTLIALRPRDVVRLLPLGVALAVVVHVLSPGALGGVMQQFDGSRLDSVSTTQHRAVAYDAVRPLVWRHVALGQGYGSYDAYVNRILDSQVLTATIETGLVGLAAYLGMILTVLVAAVRLARRRPGAGRAPPALVAAAAAAVFLTVSFLYDAMYFPHAPYIFMTFAALLAVVLPARSADGGTEDGGAEGAP